MRYKSADKNKVGVSVHGGIDASTFYIMKNNIRKL